MTKFTSDDHAYMQVALQLAERGLGNVWPNPAVGCVLVKDGLVIGRGWTQPSGRPHAETEALRRAGEQARGATAYVTLEPCSHYGKTPPCAEALINAKIARIVVALGDPDGRVSGRGMEMLINAGIQVDYFCLEDKAAYLNAGFLKRITDGRPLVTVKTATTLDGCIASKAGDSQWITGEAARLSGHQLRANHDAMLVGIGTVVADDPMLTCRLPGCEDQQPVRVVMDTNLRISLDSKLATTAHEYPTWVITCLGMNPGKCALLEDMGVKMLHAQAGGDGHIDVMAALRLMGEEGVTRVLVEGGGKLVASLLKAERVDRLYWYRASSIMGGDGVSAIAPYGVSKLAEMAVFQHHSTQQLGADQLTIYDVV